MQALKCPRPCPLWRSSDNPCAAAYRPPDWNPEEEPPGCLLLDALAGLADLGDAANTWSELLDEAQEDLTVAAEAEAEVDVGPDAGDPIPFLPR